MKFSTVYYSTTLSAVLLAVHAAPSRISDNLLARNAEAAQHLNRVFRKLTKSAACTGEHSACVNGNLAKCNQGTFQLEECPADQACFAIPKTDEAGTTTLCTTLKEVKDAIAAAGGRDGVFGTKEEPELPQPQEDTPIDRERTDQEEEEKQDKPANQEKPEQKQDNPEQKEPKIPDEEQQTDDIPPPAPSTTAAPTISTEGGPRTLTVTITRGAEPSPSPAPELVTLTSQVVTKTLDPAAVSSMLASLSSEGIIVQTKAGEPEPEPSASSVDISLPSVDGM